MKRRAAFAYFNVLSIFSALGVVSAAGCGEAYRDCHRLRTCAVPDDGGAGGDSAGGTLAGGKLGSLGMGGTKTDAGAGGGGVHSTEGGAAGEANIGGVAGSAGGLGGAAGTRGDEGACTPTETKCVGDFVVACAADGTWGNPVPCGAAAPRCEAGECVTSTSCVDLPANCGPSANESCCESFLVTGGTFYRSYDGVSSAFSDPSYPAQVSSFRLDKYEITVGRFRKFVEAWVAGWRPSSGAGKHVHLNAGGGVSQPGGGGVELGWNPEWLSSNSPSFADIPTTLSEWDEALIQGTWTSSPGANERHPIVKSTWYESYAFCIWDGGFLPTEAEWNYAAAGGNDQRVFPWGNTSPANNTELAVYGCFYGNGDCAASASIAPVGQASAGAGRYGQLDLAGNVWEWVLDWYADYEKPCTDCAQLNFTQARVYRGGNFVDAADKLLTSYRDFYPPRQRSIRIGSRCARMP